VTTPCGIIVRHRDAGRARRRGAHRFLDVHEGKLLGAAAADPEEDREAQSPERAAADVGVRRACHLQIALQSVSQQIYVES